LAGGNVNLADLGVDMTVGDSRCLDEEVWHVFLRDAEFDDGALTSELDQLRRQVHAVGWSQE